MTMRIFTRKFPIHFIHAWKTINNDFCFKMNDLLTIQINDKTSDFNKFSLLVKLAKINGVPAFFTVHNY